MLMPADPGLPIKVTTSLANLLQITLPVTGQWVTGYAELITGPVFTEKGRIRPFLGKLGRFWPVFNSQRQYS